MNSTFLKAEWRKLLMANYAVNADILKPYLPSGTELDFWNGTCYVSLVGFMFVNTRVMGIKIPLHVNFEEVNLRFYVRYRDGATWKRGVVFIKEIVPKPLLSLVANAIYKEHYETLPMKHSWEMDNNKVIIEYKWKKLQRWHSMRAHTETTLLDITEDSEEEFITEHYWGYTKLNNNVTAEYGVEHPRWQVYKTIDYHIDADFGKVYGTDFSFLNHLKPTSVFVAEGSEIEVKKGKII